MRIARFPIVLFVCAQLFCATHSSVPEFFTVQKQIDAYISSGRYEADIGAVVSGAKSYLVSRVKTGEKLAIVLDIDETAISNWKAYKLNGYARIMQGDCNLDSGPCGILAWQAMGKSPALKPTTELVDLARQKGIAVFFISGRSESIRESTERNLRNAGYQWTGVLFRREGPHFDSAIDFKVPARKSIVDQGYTIILNIGDQWSDLKGGYAERTFKLPNPVYYIP